MCDSAAMSVTLTIRLAEAEKTELERAAAAVDETVGEYVRKAVRQRRGAAQTSPWDKHLGSAEVAIPAPTNLNVRRAFAKRTTRKK